MLVEMTILDRRNSAQAGVTMKLLIQDMEEALSDILNRCKSKIDRGKVLTLSLRISRKWILLKKRGKKSRWEIRWRRRDCETGQSSRCERSSCSWTRKYWPWKIRSRFTRLRISSRFTSWKERNRLMWVRRRQPIAKSHMLESRSWIIGIKSWMLKGRMK